MRWHEIAYPRTHANWLASAALLPISWLHSACWQAYAGVYRFGLKRRRAFPLPIVGVGNLTAGGAGKTPLVIELVRLARAIGLDPAVSVSSYGSPSASGTTVLLSEDSVDPKLHGDEPALLRQEFPDLSLILGRDRVGAAAAAVQHGFPCLLLDDGFQHLPLARTADLVIWDDALPNKRMIPAGPMREPVGGLWRAKAVATPNAGPKTWNGPVFRFCRNPSGSRDVATGEELPLTWLKGRKVEAVCAIARPEPFFDTLRQLGAVLLRTQALADHAPLDGLRAAQVPTIVTTKDAIKITAHPGEFFALLERTRFEQEEEVNAWLKAQLSP